MRKPKRFVSFAFMVVACLAAVSLSASPQSAPAGPAVLLISIDGLHPGNVLEADRYGLKIPTLRRLLRQGAHATAPSGACCRRSPTRVTRRC